jgi:hypothetical protein
MPLSPAEQFALEQQEIRKIQRQQLVDEFGHPEDQTPPLDIKPDVSTLDLHNETVDVVDETVEVKSTSKKKSSSK